MDLPADRYPEDFTSVSLDYGSHGPGDTDAEEDVDGVAARHIANGSVGVLVLNGGHFAGERICCGVVFHHGIGVHRETGTEKKRTTRKHTYRRSSPSLCLCFSPRIQGTAKFSYNERVEYTNRKPNR